MSFDFKKGFEWFSIKYLRVLSDRVIVIICSSFLLLLVIIAFLEIYSFLPTHRKFLIIKNNEDPLNDHIVVSRLVSENQADNIDVLISKYLLKHYIKCRENYDKSYQNLKENSCNFFLKNYSTVIEYKKFMNSLTSDELNQNIVKYGGNFKKNIEIIDIVLYSENDVSGKVMRSFFVDCRVNFFIKNNLINSIDFRLKVKISLSNLYLISKKVIPFDFNVLEYERV